MPSFAPARLFVSSGRAKFALIASGIVRTILATACVCVVLWAAASRIHASSSFTLTTGPMQSGRSWHTATRLLDGRVLLTGGLDGNFNISDTAELYHPQSQTFTPVVGPMHSPRYDHAAALLPDGRVLVIGGYGDQQTGAMVGQAEIFDPITGAFTTTGSLNVPRVQFTATTLNDGRVLIAGGRDQAFARTSAVELYDPALGQFVSAASLATARYDHTATLLQTGDVLIAGGVGNLPNHVGAAELFQPATNAWVPGGSMIVARSFHAAERLFDGRVLFAGGWDATSNNVALAELYDPATHQFLQTGSLLLARQYPTATLLPTGKVLIAGGQAVERQTTTELFDPATGLFSDGPVMNVARSAHRATTLVDGTVLMTGTDHNQATTDASAELLTFQGETPAITWANPASIVVGTPLDTAQLNATAAVPGTFSYTPSAGWLLPVGNGQVLSVTFTPSDTAQFMTASTSVVINVVKQTPVITWQTPASIVFGTPLGGAQLNATASVPGSFTYAPPATTILAVGNGRPLTATFNATDSATYASASAQVSIDVLLSTGTFTGRVTDAVTGQPIPNATVTAHSTDGVQLGSATTDVTGRYVTPAIPIGVATAKASAGPGYIDEVYREISCALGCDVRSGTRISVPFGNGIDFTLSPLASIAGTVSTTGAAGLPGVDVSVYDVTGHLLKSGASDATGRYAVTGLQSGDYYLRTVNSLGYPDMLYDGIACALGCDVTTGTLVSTTLGAVKTANFRLSLQGVITGTVSNTNGDGVAGVTVSVYDGTAQLVKTTATDTHGRYSAFGLAGGNYFARTANSSGYDDVLYDGIACALGCNVGGGTPISTTAGLVTTANFRLPDNTPPGANVVVQPVDPGSGAQPVTLSFADVVTPGKTTLTVSSTGPAVPAGYALGSPPTYFELTTTAGVTPPITVCISYAGISFSNPSSLRLLHGEAGGFVDVTTSWDQVNQRICGVVSSLSPFVIVEVVDTTPPSIEAAASGPTGVNGGYIGPVTVTWSVTDSESGIASKSGCDTIVVSLTGTLTCSATNGVGLSNSNSITITIDATPPVLTLPGPITAEATSHDGAAVSFTASARDDVSGSVTPVCDPPSGSLFPIGDTTVHCAARDEAHNEATGSFVVTVGDTTPPQLTLPPAISVHSQTSAGTAAVSFTATATDDVDGAVDVSCSKPSGFAFGLGTTTVSCSATDAHHNAASGTFTVTVFNAAPTAVDDSISTLENRAVNVAVLANDSDSDGGTLTVTGVSAAAHGTAVATGGVVTYTPATNFYGQDSFTYTITDHQGGSATATVTVRVSRTGRFVAFSTDLTIVGDRAIVRTGDVGANLARRNDHDHDGNDHDRDDVTVRFGEGATMQQPGSRVVGDTVQLDANASIYDVIENGLIRHRRSIVNGTTTQPMAIPFMTLPTFPSITPGLQSVTVRSKATMTLGAGMYGRVLVKNGATLILTGDLYHMLSLDLEPQATVIFRRALELRIKTDVDGDNRSRLVVDPAVSGLSASQVVIFVEGAGVTFGEHSTIQANVVAPGATIRIGKDSVGVGAFFGFHVRIGDRTELTLDSAIR